MYSQFPKVERLAGLLCRTCYQKGFSLFDRFGKHPGTILDYIKTHSHMLQRVRRYIASYLNIKPETSPLKHLSTEKGR